MNTGQVLLVIAALTLLSFVTLSINSLLVSKTTTILQSEAFLTAISIGQSMMDEILVAQFDSATVPPKKVFPGGASKLTPYGRLGPESGGTTNEPNNEFGLVPLPEEPDTLIGYRSTLYYNDIDDYNNYRRYYFSRSLGTFTIRDTVFYVLDSTDQAATTQTFYKKIIITVRHPNLYFDDRTFDPWSGRGSVELSDVAVYRRYY